MANLEAETTTCLTKEQEEAIAGHGHRNKKELLEHEARERAARKSYRALEQRFCEVEAVAQGVAFGGDWSICQDYLDSETRGAETDWAYRGMATERRLARCSKCGERPDFHKFNSIYGLFHALYCVCGRILTADPLKCNAVSRWNYSQTISIRPDLSA